MTNVVLFVLGILTIVVSGGIGMYLDTERDVESPTLYWAVGVIGGVIGMALMLVSAAS